MNPKIISIPYSGSEFEDAALKYALHLAELFEGKVEGWHIMPNIEIVSMPALVYASMPYFPEEEIQNIRKIVQEKRKNAEKRFLDSTKKAAVMSSFHIVKGDYGNVMGTRGRLCDLIIMPRTQDNLNYTDVINGALFGTGRPVLFVSPKTSYKQFNGKILVAWDGSKQAASAVVSALPYMIHNQISILSVEEKGKDVIIPAIDVKMYLEAHNIHAEILPILTKESSVPVGIINTAKTLDCGLIVCGAWGHSKIREFFLGGVTDYMLNHSDIPVFMVH